MNKFNVGDKVSTNIQYMQGFDGNVTPPRGLPRLQGLTVTRVVKISDITTGSKYTNPYLYTCKSKSKEYYLNECFLNRYKGEVL